MNKQLLSCNSYCLFTFASTSQALKAEKLLKTNEAEFLVMPTLREISTSCGLAVKIAPENFKDYYNMLIQGKVSIDGVFEVEKEGRKNHINKMDIA
ncbi:MAG: DUF3343 domain-containing protein [Syntrophomonadaceae bacterium]|nr:DUF3343 domain-containing protein [Syntrophomonadaceae bacterium]